MARRKGRKPRRRSGGGRTAQRAKFGRAAKICWAEIASGKHSGDRRPAKAFGRCMKRHL